ncbi:MAG: rhomboid family intramembrane serine protease [Candidatus Riflebacteria bacterium]|nr:rhomboid family intramembrane serine protease [Candidatus Riflebacteria bacterium]
MDISYKLLMYFLIANVAFMIFSLSSRGMRLYKSYLGQLTGILVFMILSLKFDQDGLKSIFFSVLLIFLVVILPYIFQKRIEMLLLEQRFDEIEWYAKAKSLFAWTEINQHILDLATALQPFFDEPETSERNVKSLLGRGDPFDGLTRVFLAQLYIFQRKFSNILAELLPPEKSIIDCTTEELIFVARSLLETGRFADAVHAQSILEERKNSETSRYFLDSIVVSRLVLFSFLGWKEDYDDLVEKEPALPPLPPLIKDFWKGMTVFNSGKLDEGVTIMKSVLDSQDMEFYPDNWQDGIRQRYDELLKKRENFMENILPSLDEVRLKYRESLLEKIKAHKGNFEVPTGPVFASYAVIFLVVAGFIAQTHFGNSFDIGDLVLSGANNAILVKNGEYFRLFSCLFLHMGWVHFLMNLLALFYIAPSLEKYSGSGIFFGIFLFSGLCGSLATIYTHPGISVGVSGAVLGLLTASFAIEIFQTEKNVQSAGKSKFSALLFIIFLNIFIGFFEKGVDNGAHIGGMLGGFVAGLAARLAVGNTILKLIATFVSWLATAAFVAYLAMNFPDRQNELPYLFSKNFKETTIASEGYKIGVPQNWILADVKAEEGLKFSLTGPIGEKIDFILGDWYESQDELIKEYSENRTNSILKNSELSLRGVSDPASLTLSIWETWTMKWRLEAFGRPFVQKDYVCFASETLLIVQALLPTDHDSSYDKFIRQIITSVKK